MDDRCPAALVSALVCSLVIGGGGARASEGLPPIDRPVHAQVWDGESPLSAPQIEPLVWEGLGYEPRFSARIGAVILQRARPESTPFVINPVSGANIIDAEDFVFPFAGGVDAGAVWYAGWADVEVRYFGVHDWDAAPLGPIFAPEGFTIPMPGFDPALFPLYVAGWYSSALDSLEVNLRRTVLPRWAVLAGFRWVSFDERLATLVGDAGFQNGTIIAFQTRNDLFGLQIGAEGVLWRPGERFRVESAAKAGVYANAARSSIGATAVGNGGAGDNGTVWFGEDQTAFVGDLNFVAVYQLNDRWRLRGGYQLLWLAGVAVASEQIHRLNLADGAVGTNTTHGAFFHGALVGLERTW
jgi:hypothetical protein